MVRGNAHTSRSGLTTGRKAFLPLALVQADVRHWTARMPNAPFVPVQGFEAMHSILTPAGFRAPRQSTVRCAAGPHEPADDRGTLRESCAWPPPRRRLGPRCAGVWIVAAISRVGQRAGDQCALMHGAHGVDWLLRPREAQDEMRVSPPIARPAIGWLQVTGSELRMAGARFKSAVVLVPLNAARRRAMTVRFRMIASPRREHAAAYWRSSSARRP